MHTQITVAVSGTSAVDSSGNWVVTVHTTVQYPYVLVTPLGFEGPAGYTVQAGSTTGAACVFAANTQLCAQSW